MIYKQIVNWLNEFCCRTSCYRYNLSSNRVVRLSFWVLPEFLRTANWYSGCYDEVIAELHFDTVGHDIPPQRQRVTFKHWWQCYFETSVVPIIVTARTSRTLHINRTNIECRVHQGSTKRPGWYILYYVDLESYCSYQPTAVDAFPSVSGRVGAITGWLMTWNFQLNFTRPRSSSVATLMCAPLK